MVFEESISVSLFETEMKSYSLITDVCAIEIETEINFVADENEKIIINEEGLMLYDNLTLGINSCITCSENVQFIDIQCWDNIMLGEGSKIDANYRGKKAIDDNFTDNIYQSLSTKYSSFGKHGCCGGGGAFSSDGQSGHRIEVPDSNQDMDINNVFKKQSLNNGGKIDFESISNVKILNERVCGNPGGVVLRNITDMENVRKLVESMAKWTDIGAYSDHIPFYDFFNTEYFFSTNTKILFYQPFMITSISFCAENCRHFYVIWVKYFIIL